MFVGKPSEDSHPLLFRCEPAQKDRDGGFRLLNVERADLCSVLKASKKARDLLSPEIFEALANPSDHFWAQDSAEPRLIAEGSELVRKMQQIETDLRNMVDELSPNFPGVSTLDTAHHLFYYYCIQLARKQDDVLQHNMNLLHAKIEDFEKVNGAVDAFCKTDQIFQSYLSEGLGKRMGLGCQSALLFAQEKGINLRIWNTVSEKNDLWVPEGSSLSGCHAPVIDLLWHPDKCHFERLVLQPQQPAAAPSRAVIAEADPGEGPPSLVIQNLSYCLVFSPLVAWRRNAANLLDRHFKDFEFLTNILLIALKDSDPVVIRLVDKMLGKLRFDRYKQDKPISFLVKYMDYSIDRERHCIVMHHCMQGMAISLDQLHKPHPADEKVLQLPDSPLPSLHEFSPYITNTKRQEGDRGVTLTAVLRLGSSQIITGGRNSGAFDNPAGDMPRHLAAAQLPAQPATQPNPSVKRADNFILYVRERLSENSPESLKKLDSIVEMIWPKVLADPVSINRAKELYPELPLAIKQKLEKLYPAIDASLNKVPLVRSLRSRERP